jgi:hypothetical protein
MLEQSGRKPVVWSTGYPTKSSALLAKRRLCQTTADPTKKYTVEKV